MTETFPVNSTLSWFGSRPPTPSVSGRFVVRLVYLSGDLLFLGLSGSVTSSDHTRLSLLFLSTLSPRLHVCPTHLPWGIRWTQGSLVTIGVSQRGPVTGIDHPYQSTTKGVTTASRSHQSFFRPSFVDVIGPVPCNPTSRNPFSYFGGSWTFTRPHPTTKDRSRYRQVLW